MRKRTGKTTTARFSADNTHGLQSMAKLSGLSENAVLQKVLRMGFAIIMNDADEVNKQMQELEIAQAQHAIHLEAKTKIAQRTAEIRQSPKTYVGKQPEAKPKTKGKKPAPNQPLDNPDPNL